MADVTGVDQVIANMNKAVEDIEQGAFEGVLKAATFVQGEAIEITPQKTGVLIGSSFTSFDREHVAARVGYTAKHAPFVHEMPDPFPRNPAEGTGLFFGFFPVQWTKPGTGNKFLQKAVDLNLSTIFKFIFEKTKSKVR